MPSGARAISGPAGTSRRCAARATTPATASRMALDDRRAAVRPMVGLPCGEWDRNAPDFGELARRRRSSRSTPIRLGIMVNAHGERFVDEGADFRNYTYAKIRPRDARAARQFAWQIFDAQGRRTLLRDEYRIAQRDARLQRRHARGAGRASSTASTRERFLATVARLQRGGRDATCRSIPNARTAAARAGSRCRSRTGRTRSTSRRSRPTR